MNNRVWIISEFYYPDENATGYLLTQIAEGIAKSEEVRVLCGRYACPTSKSETSVYERNKVFVKRVNSSIFNKNIFFLRLINNITLSVKILLRLIKDLRHGDKVLVVTNPPSLPFVVSIASRWKRALYFVLIFDVYPEVLVVAGLFNNHNPIVYLMKWITQILLSKAQKVIVLGRDMYKLLQLNYRVTSDHLIIIPNWGDIEHTNPADQANNSIRRELKLENKFIIQYVGNIGRTHNIELLASCAKLLSERNDIFFLFIGNGAKKNWLSDFVDRYSLKNVKVIPFYPRNRQSDVHTAGDITVVSFIPGMSGISVPSRMYDIMAAGKPIIAITDDESELAMVVREENIGWVITSYQVQDVIDVILSAMKNRTLLLEMGQRARRAAEEKYCFKKIIPRYRDLLVKEFHG